MKNIIDFIQYLRFNKKGNKYIGEYDINEYRKLTSIIIMDKQLKLEITHKNRFVSSVMTDLNLDNPKVFYLKNEFRLYIIEKIFG